jgi:RNA polymerase sigma-70 factor (ECF subfamily)
MVEQSLNFDQIHAEYHAKVQRFLVRLVGETEAEDLTQEVFIKINRALPKFRGGSKLSTWIYRIAENAAYDRMRSASFQRVLPVSEIDEGEPGETDLAEQGARRIILNVEEDLFRKQRFRCYCDFVETLPENYRRIVALAELEELAVNEIADLIGLSVDVVKIRLHRGRERLLKELVAHCKPEDWL